MRPLFEQTPTRLSLPGFVSAHSHAFQRALRGKTQRTPAATGTFWSWREAMFSLVDGLTPESLGAVSRQAFDELRAAGVTAVGEFHYVHHQPGGIPYAQRTLLADVVIEAALAAGLQVCLLRVAYARAGAGREPEGGQRRFCDASVEDVVRDVEALQGRWGTHPGVRVGIAPHSVRAVPREWITALHAVARSAALPFHMHVAEVQGEVDACVAEHGLRPVEFLAGLGVLDPRFVAVHATRLEPHEARLLGEAGAMVCACPSTERDLGDGLADLGSLREAGVRLCTGIDSHVVTDPVEEMRALESHERLRLRRRVTFEPPAGRTPAMQLALEASVYGAQACGWDATLTPTHTTWNPRTLVDLTHPTLAGVAPDEALDAFVFSGHPGCVVPAEGP